MHHLLTQSATQIARLIRTGEVRSAEVMEVFIERIQAVNPRLNAVVETRFDLAREEAQAADARLKNAGPEGLPLFHGVPCTIKEAFSLKGMPNTGGLVSRKGLKATEDATAVRRLREAGAIPLGVTNVSELCMWMESNNRVYGRTNNPYDLSRTAGGSSGGEGSVVGSAGSPFGLGSDIGGSIRMPAFFNGVFGHKPSGGLVPGTGQFPNAENDARRMLSVGPITRYAEDLMPLLRILAGPDGIDASCDHISLGDPDTVKMSEIRVLSVSGNRITPVSQGLIQAQNRCAEMLRDLGAEVDSGQFKPLRYSLFIWASRMKDAEETSFTRRMGVKGPISLMKECAKLPFGVSRHTREALMLGLVEHLPGLTGRRARRFVDAGRRLREEIEAGIGDNGVMLYPSYSTVAPRHGRPFWSLTLPWIYPAIINALELPSTQVPLGLDSQGLPLGIQVVGAHGKDHLTIAVAKALERCLGGWVPPVL